MNFLTDWSLLVPFYIGLLSAISLPLGAMLSFVWKPEQRVIAVLMAFGAGSLLAAVSVDLVGNALSHGEFNSLALGSLIGGILFITLDNIVNNYGGYKRKFSTAVYYLQDQNKKQLKNTLANLGRIEIFNDLNNFDVEYLSKSIQTRFYAKGSKIFSQQEMASELYIIKKGSVCLYESNEDSKEYLYKNDAFGKNALFTGSPYVFNAVALEDCYISVIPKENLEALLFISNSYREHILFWLLGDEIYWYLKYKQKLDDQNIKKWQAEVSESFNEECILPDIVHVYRNEEQFIKIAPHIARVSWLEDLSLEESQNISKFLIYRTFKKDEMLFMQDEPAQYFYMIDQGEVLLQDKNDTNKSYKQTDCDGIGSLAFLCGLRHTMSAKALSDVTVWVLKREDLGKILFLYPDFRLKIQFYLQSNTIKTYLQKNYSLNQGKVISWLSGATNRVKHGQLPTSLLQMGVESTIPHGASLAIWLGILLDGIPESLVIGASMIHQTISISLVAGLFLSNFPEALSSSRGMEEEGLSKKKIFIMWSSIALFTGIGALVGNILMQSATIGWFAFLQGIAAGAMLTMIAQTMLPEAYMKGGSVTGFSTLVGFLLTISLKGFE